MQNLQSLLTKLVSFNSVYPQEKAVGLYLANLLRGMGFEVKKQKVAQGRFNLLAKRGSGKRAVMFYGHLDTVGLDLKLWKSNPMKLTLKGDLAYGLGSYDMKGGIASFLMALMEEKTAYVKVLLAVDEENISLGAWQAITNERAFFDDVSLIISAEPNFGFGSHSLTVGRTGRVIFQGVAKGKAVHIAEYKKGVDAIELTSKFLLNLYSKRNKLFKSSQTIAQVRQICGAANGMSVCDRVEFEIEVLLGKEDTVDAVLKKLAVLSGQNISIRIKPRLTPYLEGYRNYRFSYKNLLGSIIKNELHKEMVLVERSSVGDDNVMAGLSIPVITWGPDGGNAHSANEYVSLSSLEKLKDMFVPLLRNL